VKREHHRPDAQTPTAAVAPAARFEVPAFRLEEASIGDLRALIDAGTESSRSITEAYLDRIERLDSDRDGPQLRAILEVVKTRAHITV